MIILLHDIFVVNTLSIKMMGHLLICDDWFKRYEQICNEGSFIYRF